MPASHARAVSPSGVCAIVVTYHPDERSHECLRTVTDTAAHTVVVDNHSEDGRLQRLRSANVTMVENADNVGIGAALNQGVRAAAELGYRWFLLFDQDTKIFPNTIADLVEVVNEYRTGSGAPLGLLGANFFPWLADGTVHDAPLSYCPGRRWAARDLLITSGTLLSLESFGAIGAFSEKYFVDHVDHEYSLRARLKGFMTARSLSPLMLHRIGKLRLPGDKLDMGVQWALTDYPPLRRYYQIRNYLLLARQYRRHFPGCIAQLGRNLRREVKRVAKHGPQRVLNMLAVLEGIVDAKRGVAGAYAGRLLSSGAPRNRRASAPELKNAATECAPRA